VLSNTSPNFFSSRSSFTARVISSRNLGFGMFFMRSLILAIACQEDWAGAVFLVNANIAVLSVYCRHGQTRRACLGPLYAGVLARCATKRHRRAKGRTRSEHLQASCTRPAGSLSVKQQAKNSHHHACAEWEVERALAALDIGRGGDFEPHITFCEFQKLRRSLAREQCHNLRTGKWFFVYLVVQLHSE